MRLKREVRTDLSEHMDCAQNFLLDEYLSHEYFNLATTCCFACLKLACRFVAIPPVSWMSV